MTKPNQTTFSTQTIVVLLVFLCAAIMTSLFVYHMRAQSIKPMLSENLGTQFSEPREIKPFELVAATGEKFSQKNLFNHWTLLFFGFTHCGSVCPTTMDLMNRVYAPLQKKYTNLQVVLISLDPERDTKAALLKYTHSFNSEFIGVSGKIEDLRKLQSQLGVYSARDDGNDVNYQLRHTASIFLINPEGKWSSLFKFGLTPAQLTEAVDVSIKSSV